jgi:FeS assembly SUF system protein
MTLSPEKIEEIKSLTVQTLKTVYDPEIPVDIYELGLVYGIEVSPDGVVDIRMTLTSPGCPVAGSLPREVELKTASIEGVSEVRIDLVWDPPWTPERMSEAARLELDM